MGAYAPTIGPPLRIRELRLSSCRSIPTPQSQYFEILFKDFIPLALHVLHVRYLYFQIKFFINIYDLLVENL